MTLTSFYLQTTKIVNGLVIKTHHVADIPLTFLMTAVFSVELTSTLMLHRAQRVILQAKNICQASCCVQ